MFQSQAYIEIILLLMHKFKLELMFQINGLLL